MSGDIELRPITDADRELLLRIYASTRADELTLAPWTDEQKRVFLLSQFEMQHSHYVASYPGASFDVVLVDGEPAGRLYAHRRADEIRIVDIALLPGHRGRGIGGRLLAALIDEAERASRTLTVHVLRGNPARRLYERLGFRQTRDDGVYDLMERAIEHDTRSPDSPPGR